MTESSTSPAAWAWEKQSVWSAAATGLHDGVVRWRRAALALTGSGAVLAALSATVTPYAAGTGRWIAWVAAVCVGVAPFAVRRTTRPYLEQWTRTRAVSECLKAEVFTYLARAEPYAGADRDRVLDRQIEAVLQRADDLAVHTLAVRARQRPLPAVDDLSGYLDVRVRGQVDGFYRTRALRLSQLGNRVRVIELVLAAAGVALLAAGSTWDSGVPGGWAPVATTLAAAVAAYGAAARYEALPVEYARTAAELDRLAHDARPGDATRTHVDAVVHAVEHVIARENRSWTARTLGAADRTGDQPSDETRSPVAGV